MIRSLLRVYSLFRPDDTALSSEARSQIQIHRLLTVLGMVLVPLFGLLHGVSNPDATDPTWARLAVTGLFASLFGASYASRQIRRNYVLWLRGAIYVLMGWIVLVAALNGFSSDYLAGALVLYAVLAVGVGVGARSMRPVLLFLGAGLLLTALSTTVAPALQTSPLILFANLSTLALLEGIAICAHLSTRESLREREERLHSITENVSDGIYRSTSEEGLVYANQAFAEMFGYQSVEDVLEADPRQMYADPERRKRLRRLARKEGAFDGEEVEFRREDGSTFPGLLDATVVRGENGEVEYYDGAVTDLTEQKRREEKLRVMAQALEQAGDKIVITDREGEIRYVNEAFEEITGYREEEVVGETPAILQSGVQEEDFYEELWETILSGKTFRAEFVNEKKDGSRYVEDENISPVTDEEGQVTHFVSTGRDVTERKEREAALRQQRNLLGQAQRLAGAWEADLQADELLWTDEIYRIHELSPDTEIGVERAIDFYAPEARPKLREAYERCVKEGEPYDLEVPIITAEGNRRWIRTTGAPVEEKDGEILKVAGAAQDITERKTREQALRDRQEKVEALYAATDRLLRAEDEKEVGTSIMNLVHEVFGYPLVVVRFARDDRLVPVQLSPEISEHMPERPVFDVDGESVVAEAFRENGTATLNDLRTVDDPFDYGDVRAAVILPMGTHGTISIGDLNVGTIGDFDRRLFEVLATYAALVLDRIEREQELVAAKEEAEEASHLKSAMLANMSHEVRTPLTSINGFSEVLKEELSDPHASLAERVHQSGRRLMKTLDSVLELSKLESGVYQLKREPVCLGEVAGEAVDLLRSKAKKKSLTLRTTIPTSPVEGFWNEGALHRIVENLLENAVKFTPEDGRVDIRVQAEGEEAILEVEDTGIGISEEAIPQIFEAFKQESEGLSREYEGSGLGLSIVEEMTEALGGSVEVETEKGEGTCFTVRLPLREENEEEPGRGTSRDARAESMGQPSGT